MSYTLTLEIPITRRKKLHQVHNESGDLKFTSMSTSQCLEYLYENDIRRVEVISPNGHWLLDFEAFPWQDDRSGQDNA